MSNLEPKFLVQYLNPEVNAELAKKYEKMFQDNKHFFLPETYEEDERHEKRIKVNQRLLKIIAEAKKILPLREVFNDAALFFAFINTFYMYNPSISTKLVVNLQLYYKTIVNLGSEIHDEWARRCEEGIDIGCFGLTEMGHGSNARGI